MTIKTWHFDENIKFLHEYFLSQNKYLVFKNSLRHYFYIFNLTLCFRKISMMRIWRFYYGTYFFSNFSIVYFFFVFSIFFYPNKNSYLMTTLYYNFKKNWQTLQTKYIAGVLHRCTLKSKASVLKKLRQNYNF